MNRVIEMVPTRTVIVVLTGVGLIAVAGLAAQYILIQEVDFGSEVEVAAGALPAPNSDGQPDAIGRDLLFTGAREGSAAEVGLDAVGRDLLFTGAREGSAAEVGLDVVGREFLFTAAREGSAAQVDRDFGEAFNHRGFITQVGEGRASAQDAQAFCQCVDGLGVWLPVR